MKTHICLVSTELMANIIGTLFDRADHLVPVITPAARRMVGYLEDALAATGATVSLGDPVEVIPFDLEDCLSTLRRVGEDNPTAAFNWSGGTKIMSYAARRVAEERRARALFIRPDSREILVEDLATGNSRTEMTEPTRCGLNLLAHFLAAGHSVAEVRSAAEFRVRYTPSPDLVVAANAVMDASSSERGDLFQLAGAVEVPVAPHRLNSGFLYILRRAQLIEPGPVQGQFFLSATTTLPRFHLEPAQATNARFLRASYLEVFLWSQIRERSGITDVGWEVRLNSGEQGRMAEIDIAVASDGRLLILEAKTNVELSRLADLIEEQAARCRRLGGRFADWMLYIHKFRAELIGAEASPILAAQEARAIDYGGQIVWHDDLNDLPEILARRLHGPIPEL